MSRKPACNTYLVSDSLGKNESVVMVLYKGCLYYQQCVTQLLTTYPSPRPLPPLHFYMVTSWSGEVNCDVIVKMVTNTVTTQLTSPTVYYCTVLYILTVLLCCERVGDLLLSTGRTHQKQRNGNLEKLSSLLAPATSQSNRH